MTTRRKPTSPAFAKPRLEVEETPKENIKEIFAEEETTEKEEFLVPPAEIEQKPEPVEVPHEVTQAVEEISFTPSVPAPKVTKHPRNLARFSKTRGV